METLPPTHGSTELIDKELECSGWWQLEFGDLKYELS